jgi:hypothetical protein
MRDRGKIARKLANAIDAEPRLAAKVRNAIEAATNGGDSKPPKAVRDAVERFRKAATAGGYEVTITAGGATATIKPDKPKAAPKKAAKGGTTAKRISAAVKTLPEAKARSLLSEVGSSFLEEERLREEKREERKEINDRIKGRRDEIAEAVKGAEADDDPAATLRRVEELWTENVDDEKELADVTKDFTDRINQARDRIRSTLDNLRQEKLPGIG